ncbi:hypothetical protein KL86APRO_30186 [uncultured Alphaproteobacteria bacterium]|uniref:Uncharacterized protein n=1 Tax=uncultured Alphaproteobacteria bacterium TaxID=91750 RepID=A0A212KM84_9PROT|nr:hypothetical protein KL86APRO_30186 [uncultured Alphaproteobacteria bacterium]
MVERYQPGQAQARALPSVTLPRADAESFGAQQGRALARAGQGVMNLAAQVDQTQSLIDEARAKDAYSSTSEAMLKVVSDFGNKRGRDAIDGTDEALVTLQDLARQGEDLLETDPQKKMFKRAVSARLGMFSQSVSDHRNREALTYANQADAANVATLSQDLVASWNRPDERAVKWAAIKSTIESSAARNGWAPEVKELKLREAETSVYSDLTRRFLSKGDVGGAEAFYRENAGKFHGDAAAKMEEAINTARLRAEAQHRARVSEATAALQGAAVRMTSGYGLPQEEIVQISRLVAQSGDPDVAAKYREMEALQRDVSGWSEMTPRQLSEVIAAELEPAMRQNGASQPEYNRLATAQRLLSNMSQQIAHDPLGWAAHRGAIDLVPLNTSNAQSIKDRAAKVNAVGQAYGNTAFFTPAEVAAERGKWAGMQPEQKVAYAMALHDNAGPTPFLLAMNQIAKNGGMTDAYLGGLAASSPYGAVVAANAWRGREILANDKTRNLSSDQVNAAFRSVMGDAARYLPPAEVAAVKDVADAIYAQANGAPDAIDTAKYAEAIRQAVGGTANDGTGLGEVNGVDTILPPQMTEKQFRTFIEGATSDDWARASVTGHAPVYRTGEAVRPGDIADEGTFYMVGPGRYQIVMKSDGLPLLDPSGAPFIATMGAR